MRKTRQGVKRLVTILCAAIFVCSFTVPVFAATDLVGRGTTGGVSTSGTTTVTRPGATSDNSTNTADSSTTSTAQTQEATPTFSSQATVSTVQTTVQTGVMEKLTPFLIGIGIAFLIFWMFFHLQMNQVRYGKSEKYYKELLDFLCACRQ